MKDTIMEMPDYQRPYEKCLREGEQSLSDRELLAVILRCGVQGSSSLTLADKILNLSKQTGYSGLLGLFHISMQELMKIHGIGKVKSHTAEMYRGTFQAYGNRSCKTGIIFSPSGNHCEILYGAAPA